VGYFVGLPLSSALGSFVTGDFVGLSLGSLVTGALLGSIVVGDFVGPSLGSIVTMTSELGNIVGATGAIVVRLSDVSFWLVGIIDIDEEEPYLSNSPPSQGGLP